MVRLIRLTGSLVVSPWSDVLNDELTYTRRTREGWPVQYKNTRYALYTLHQRPEGTIALTFPGLYRRATEFLRKQRIPFTVEDKREPLPEARLQNLQPLRKRQEVLIAALVSSYEGILKGPTGFGKSFLIVQAARIYPTQRILVITPERAVVNEIHDRLIANTKDLGLLIGKCDGTHRCNPECNVIVTTTGSLHKIAEDWPQLILFDEVHGSAADRISTQLAGYRLARTFGLSASPAGRSDGADRLTEALFGPVIAEISYQTAEADGVVAPIVVHFFPVRLPEIVVSTDVARERYGYWQNHERNQRAVELMNRFFQPDDQVLIMTKTVEHALYLRRLLPDWPIVHSGVDKEKWIRFAQQQLVPWFAEDELVRARELYVEEGSRKAFSNYQVDLFTSGRLIPRAYTQMNDIDVEQYKRDFKAGTLRRAIATTMWKQGVDFPQLVGLIRVDGASSAIPAIQQVGRLSRISEGKQRGVVIDFIDDFGPGFLKRSKQRLRHYRREGWEIVIHE